MTNVMGWNHPKDDSDQWDGFNEPGIEHFAGSPIRHLAREVNQNSLDSSDGTVVKVSIKHLSVLTSEIPNVDELKRTVELCRKNASQESAKAEQFFKTATAELAKKKISILQIMDFHTRGMKGPSKNGTPFYAFTKAKGQSKKDSSTAAGSFGIGKFAPYAVSKLRTVFVSTVYEDENGKHQQLTQGKSILMSHDKGATRLQGTGFWGVRLRCQPVEGIQKDLPNWLQRASTQKELSSLKGTKLTILGFDVAPSWEENLAVSIAENFFGAISSGRLEVNVAEKYPLDAESIGNFFASQDIRNAIKNHKNEPDQFDNCRNYLSTLQGNTEVLKEETEDQILGLCELRILLNEGLPKKVCFLRNGMFISDSLSLPGLKNFSDFKEFVAVVECKTKKGNEILRAMEPPRHDDFEPDRLPTKEEQIKGGKALKNLAVWIRDMLKRHAKNPVSEVTTLDELKEYFADESGDGSGKGTEEIDPNGKIIIRAKPLKIKLNSNTQDNQGGRVASQNESDDGGGSKDGVGGGDGLGGAGAGDGGTNGINYEASSPRQIASINNIRAVSVNTNSRRISFTPASKGQVSVGVLEAGADSDYEIAIATSDIGTLKNGKVVLDVSPKTRVSMEITLSENFAGALKVVAYEV